MTDWIILRCQGRATLRLAETLAKDGYEVWTPRETRRIRIPRMNVRREAVLPLMPSYIFAKATHLVDLLELAAMPVKPRRGAGLMDPAHASFTVMHAFDRIPMVADIALSGLRHLEAKRTPTKKAERSFQAGTSVRMEGGSFGGLSGLVERSDRSHTVVCFNDRFVVKISTSLLHPDDIGMVAPSVGPALRRAA